MSNNIKNELSGMLKNKIIIVLSIVLLLFAIINPFIIKKNMVEPKNISTLLIDTQYKFDENEPVYNELSNALNENRENIKKILINSNINTENELGILVIPELERVTEFNILADFYNKGIKFDIIQKNYQNQEVLEMLNNYISASNENKIKIIENNQNNINQNIKILFENDYKLYNNILMEKLEKNNVELENEKNNLIPNEENNKIINEIENKKNINNEEIEILKYRNDKNITYNIRDWKDKALITISNYIATKYSTLLTKEEFEKEYSDSYENYLLTNEKNKALIKRNYLISKSALENNKEDIIFMLKESIQNNLINSMNIFTYTSYIAIIIVIVYTFSLYKKFKLKKSFNKKFLISKIISITMYSYILGLIGYILNNMIFGFLFGFDGLTNSVSTVVNNNVFEINFILYFIPKIISCILPIIFLIVLSLFLLVIIKNSILSISLMIFIKISVMPIVFILSGLNPFILNIYGYTPFPYLELYNIYSINNKINGFLIFNNLGELKGNIILILYVIIIMYLLIITCNKKNLDN